MTQSAAIVMEGVRVIQGTPAKPLTGPTVFLHMWKVSVPTKPEVTMASLSMARPGVNGYITKDLIPDMECPPKDALDKAIAVAIRGDVSEVYVNANLEQLPALGFVTAS